MQPETQKNQDLMKIMREENVIPSKYKNLPSEVAEELWQPKIYADSEKTKAEKERREQGLNEMRKQEEQREKDKEGHFAQIYANLTPEKQKDFASFQNEAAKEIGAHLKGTAQIPNLAREEAFVLSKMQEAYKQSKKKNPNQPIQIQLDRPIDQAVYKNLVRRLGWEKIKDKIEVEEQKAISSIQEQLQGKAEKMPLTQEQIEHIKIQAANYRRKEGNDVNNDLMLNPINGEIGRNFDAHGLAKINEFVQLDQLIELLGKGIDPTKEFFTAPLALRPEDPRDSNTAGGKALNTGSFIVLGEHGKSIKQEGIKYVLVNDMYYQAIPELTKAYPNIEFIRADQANERLKEITKNKAYTIPKKEMASIPSPDLLKNSRYFIMGWSTFGGRFFGSNPEYANISKTFLSTLDNVRDSSNPTPDELKKIAKSYITLRDWVFQHGGEEEFKKITMFEHVEKSLRS